MKVTIRNPKEVILDGINIGNVADAIANMPTLAPDIQRALEDWWQQNLLNTVVVKEENDGKE